MDFRQIIKHWQLAPWRAQHCFDQNALQAIEEAIRASETVHRGELRFVLDRRFSLFQLLRGLTARQRAEALFDELGMLQTAERSGILIYVMLAEQKVEIVADRGIAAQVSQAQWNALCDKMTACFARGDYRGGAQTGIAGATELLACHFPVRDSNPNELDDKPLLL